MREEKVPLKNIISDNKLRPPDDPVFSYLLEDAVKGRIPVYYAAVPLELVRPFAPDFHPEEHPIGKQAMQAIFDNWQSGKFIPMWVYPRNDNFIMSDDYITYAAALKGQPDYVPCWVLGDPKLPGVKDIQGPIKTEDILKILGC
jgi:hypothetical protein